MNALYAHSFCLQRTADGNVYSRFPYPQRWERYLKHFHELHVVCRMVDVTEPTDNMVVASGPNVFIHGTPNDHNNLLLQLQSGQAKRTIKNTIGHCDAVIVRQSKLGWLAAKAAADRNIPWAVEVVGDAWDSYWNYGKLTGRLYAPIAYLQARRWIKRAPFAIYVTNHCLQERYPCFGTTSNASNVEIEPVPTDVLAKRLKKSSNNIRDGKIQIRCGLIGDLTSKYKGLDVALRSLKVIRNHGFNLHLYQIGTGKQEHWIKMAEVLELQNSLHLQGCLPPGQPVFEWLDNLDFYIQPSLTEGLPRALIEAMSRGLPCLASTCGGIPELLPAECLHKPGDYKKLADDMLRMIEDNEWRLQMAERNFNEATQYYSDVVKTRRDAFWSDFAEYARGRKSL